MTPIKQTITHDPENGKYGNCMQAVFASILDLPLEEVPHFMEKNPSADYLWPAVNKWLASKGYALFTTMYTNRLDDIQYYMKNYNDGVYYILSGTSPRGFCHNVIGMGNDIVHDPAPDGGGIVDPGPDGYYWVEVLVPAKMCSVPFRGNMPGLMGDVNGPGCDPDVP